MKEQTTAPYCKVCGGQTTNGQKHKHQMAVGVYLGNGCWARRRGGGTVKLLYYRVRG